MMDHNTGAKDPLLSPLSGVSTKTGRFRRSRSAPAVDLVRPVENTRVSNSLPRSVWKNLHPSFKQVALLLIIYLGIGCLCFSIVGYQIKGKKTSRIVDALYLCIVTMTTVGYGDLVPDSVTAKLLACAFVFTGMALVGILLSKAADYLVEKQEVLLVKALHLHHKTGEAEIIKETETNRVKYKFLTTMIILIVLMIMGTLFLHKIENLSLIDSFYCVCSTVTTLGYGDRSFSTKAGRIFAIFWILASTLCVAQFYLYLTELSTEKRQQAIAEWALTRGMTFIDLEAADLDEDGVVSASEFILYKLKEMGKISEEDISVVKREFENLDFDHSGTLSASDLVLAQLQ